ncbi:4Fe-4S dicluster domain-containing protein [Alkaliphilus metalliredigens]|nr:4Fe-4S dicluster domain-containing protein [Alkaliphilus metalliredigens]
MKFITADSAYCLGCKGCELACTSRKASIYAVDEARINRTVVPNIIVTQSQDMKIPAHCRHCQEAFCLQLCPTKAITQEKKVVVINDDKCTGCGICEQGCPYGVITMAFYTKDQKIKKIANKCDMCMDRQSKDEDPLCYTACPTKAISLL